jgi:hypothetical protein
LWDIVARFETRPKDATRGENGEERNKEAFMIIMLLVVDDVILQMQDAKDAFKAWKKLQALYKDTNKTCILY